MNKNILTLTSSIDGELLLKQHVNMYAPTSQLPWLVDINIDDNEFADETSVPDTNDTDNFIDAHINDINRLFITTELYITLGLV